MNNIIENIRSFEYDFYYISIGGACTESTISDVPYLSRSNCEYQLFPNFIRNDKRILNIVIEPSFFEETKSLINNYKKQYPNMKTFFIPCSIPQFNLEQSSFYLLFQQLISIWNEKQIPKNKIVIIDFIQFKLPNEMEKSLRLAEQIYKSLQNSNNNEDSDNSQRQNHYHHCLYIWFGYSPLFFNCFYKYKYYDNQAHSYMKFSETFQYCFYIRSHKDFLRNVLILSAYGKHVLSSFRHRKDREKLEKMALVEQFYENNLHFIKKEKIEENEKVHHFLKNSFCLLSSNFEIFYKQIE
jgi:hypothetical protein